MKLSEVLFIDSFPSLDLHGLDRDYARIKINEFIEDNSIIGNEFLAIVHGVGSGILKSETAETLKKNKKVIEYQLFRANIGCTIVKIVRK
jgi:Mismatch repair ATPase (MutS family)